MVYFLLTLVIFASMEAVSKPLMGTVDPFVLTFWRFAIGFIFFLFYPGVRKRFSEIGSFSLKEWFSVIILGLLNSFLAMSFLQVAVKMSSAATAATIFCSNPVFVLLFASVFRLESLTAGKMAGVLTGFAAVAVIMSEKGFVLNKGMIFALFAAVIFAFYTVFTKKTLSKISPFTVNLVSFFAGSVVNLVFILIYGLPLMPDTGFYEVEKIAAFVYLGIFVTGFGYVTFFETIKRFTALGASLIFLFKPAVAVIFAVIFLKESLSGTFFAGLVLLCVATVLILMERLKMLLKSVTDK